MMNVAKACAANMFPTFNAVSAGAVCTAAGIFSGAMVLVTSACIANKGIPTSQEDIFAAGILTTLGVGSAVVARKVYKFTCANPEKPLIQLWLGATGVFYAFYKI